MLERHHPMRGLLQAIFLGLLACSCSSSAASDGGESAGGGGAATPAGTEFSGSYEVPTQPQLQSAAQFPVASITWSVAGSSVRLAYDLPKELLGKSLRVAFEGALDGQGSAALTGEPGDATCQVMATQVVCQETLRGLLPLEPDLSEVERLASKTYSGPAQDRLDVAKLFSVDPIGVVTVDLSTPRGASEAEPSSR